jgi:hypothetical protein
MSKEQLNEKAEGIVDNFLASKFVTNVKLVALTIRTLVLIVVPLVVAGYLYQTQTDKVVLGLAIAIAIFGGLNLVKLAFGYENLARTAKKRR